MQRARQLVLASVLDQTFNTIDPSLFDLDQCWQHLIASALLADAVAWNCSVTCHSHATPRSQPASCTM